MSPLVVVIIGSAVVVLGLLLLAAVCACVIAGRADRLVEARQGEATGPRLLAAVNALGDDADHLWAEPRGAEVIPFPARLRALR